MVVLELKCRHYSTLQGGEALYLISPHHPHARGLQAPSRTRSFFGFGFAITKHLEICMDEQSRSVIVKAASSLACDSKTNGLHAGGSLVECWCSSL